MEHEPDKGEGHRPGKDRSFASSQDGLSIPSARPNRSSGRHAKE
ncbi:MAG: hypothetical protein JWO95_2655 [Verrucomicrobiales bacterium]|nr:hypothetical protein [Verrucomicrobiales bacterium]